MNANQAPVKRTPPALIPKVHMPVSAHPVSAVTAFRVKVSVVRNVILKKKRLMTVQNAFWSLYYKVYLYFIIDSDHFG